MEEVKAPQPERPIPSQCPVADPALAGLSKNQRKKLLREQQWEATREERKQKRKELRKALIKRKREEIRSGERAPKRRRPAEQLETDVGVIIDLDFQELMNPKEIISVSKQMVRSYSESRFCPKKTILIASSYKGPIREAMDKFQAQWTSWKMSFEERPFDAIVPKESLVYLTADSPNVIETLEANKYYVIGGIVDKNRHKGLCYQKALDAGIAHGRLPIAEFISMDSRKVLTINQVYEIILNYLAMDNWRDAFLATIPARKGAQVKDSHEDQSDSGDESESSGDEDLKEHKADGDDSNPPLGDEDPGIDENTSEYPGIAEETTEYPGIDVDTSEEQQSLQESVGHSEL
ncbi:guanine-1-methyltransferase-domain-containing protein [Polychytrium aggregatum]|uniref:guanine-1-methyltransferase-domain-containing protein n=1 Tax=Polychytrium aggregatum TaxID=110093 RepID=UPI0022FE840D|nr:guanine-1-methyltransferase-domain-containing protein [Polychytrium aggregatum]KAI9209012.1 guanine-1-methyltransferase-domain-containing protein [Polychytrium aggregatum]